MISGKWKPAILNKLLKTNQRLRDIQKGLPEASKRALTQQLSEMIKDGLIEKKKIQSISEKNGIFNNSFRKKTFFCIQRTFKVWQFINRVKFTPYFINN